MGLLDTGTSIIQIVPESFEKSNLSLNRKFLKMDVIRKRPLRPKVSCLELHLVSAP